MKTTRNAFLPGAAGFLVMAAVVGGFGIGHADDSGNAINLTLTKFTTAPGKEPVRGSSFDLTLSNGESAEIVIGKEGVTLTPVLAPNGALKVAFVSFKRLDGSSDKQAVASYNVLVKPGETAVVPGKGQEYRLMLEEPEVAEAETPEATPTVGTDEKSSQYFGTTTLP
jgi:hypothetical protein